ncbi:MAG: SDR family oxidoreductase [Planctomycetes bacterium]|nr:SDR family oxidoreductase [Planctomycetota bacterium]
MNRDAPRAAGTAVVTGAGSGVGRATARRLAARGHDVVLIGRGRTALDAVAAEVAPTGARTAVVAADVADRAAVEAGLRGARATLGPVRVVVHAAGIAESSPLLPPDDALFDRTVATNLRGAWVVTTACLPDMVAARRGTVVHVASTAGLRGFRYVAAYVASKHGVVGLARAMAEDLRSKGVAVHAVCPGFLDTPMTARTIDKVVAATGRSRAEALADVLASGGQARLLSPEEVVDAIVRLIDDPSSTGSVVEL